MDSVKYKASCPVCGRNLFKGTPNSYMEGNCPKCGTYLQILFETNGYKIETGSSVPDAVKNKAVALH